MIKTNHKLTFLFIAVSLHSFSQETGKCDLTILKKVNDNITALDEVLVTKFILTMDKSCENSVEFSEWYNELTFEILQSDIQLLGKILNQLGNQYVSGIVQELESPVHDEYDLQMIYDRIKNDLNDQEDIQTELENAILRAAKKSNIEIK